MHPTVEGRKVAATYASVTAYLVGSGTVVSFAACKQVT